MESFGKKVVKGAKKTARVVEQTGRKVVNDNPQITAGAKTMVRGAKEMAGGVAKGLAQEAQHAYSDAVARKIKEKTAKLDKY